MCGSRGKEPPGRGCTTRTWCHISSRLGERHRRQLLHRRRPHQDHLARPNPCKGCKCSRSSPGPLARPLAVVSFDDGLGQRQVNKASSSRPKASDPQFAQPCAFANVPQTRREHRHPLLIPRSLVRSQHGPSSPSGYEIQSGKRPRASERSLRPAPHGESQGHRPYPSVRGRIPRATQNSCPTGCRLGQRAVNHCICRTVRLRAPNAPSNSQPELGMIPTLFIASHATAATFAWP